MLGDIFNGIKKIFSYLMDNFPEFMGKVLKWSDKYLNPNFTNETAEDAVSELEHKDGKKGEHYNYDEAKKLMKNKGYDFNGNDWYYTLNQTRATHYKSGRSDETYAELAADLLEDHEGPHYNAKAYYNMTSRRRGHYNKDQTRYERREKEDGRK